MNTKILFSDMEGTIFRPAVKGTQGIAPSAWTLLAERLGPEAHEEEEQTKKRWKAGGYRGYIEWMDDSIRIHQKYGLTRSFFEEVMNSIEFYPGVEETFKELQSRGVVIALISGGFKYQADRAQALLGIRHALSGCEYFWKGERLVGWNLLPSDYENKARFMAMIRDSYKIPKKETAFVGDGENDVTLAQTVEVSIAFNAVSELERACTYAIRQPKGEEDFREVLKYIR